MAVHVCPGCGALSDHHGGVPCSACQAPPTRQATWARVALLATVLVTVGIAAMVLVMTVRGMHLPH